MYHQPPAGVNLCSAPVVGQFAGRFPLLYDSPSSRVPRLVYFILDLATGIADKISNSLGKSQRSKPMPSFRFDLPKAIAAASYIAHRLGDGGVVCDYYKIFKILYFADRGHLAKYGRPVVSDSYAALPDGPVPQNLYDLIKEIKDPNRSFKRFNNPEQYFAIQTRYVVEPLADPDMDELSESDVECLDISIEDNKNLSYDELKEKSHGSAWAKTSTGSFISTLDIAAEGGAGDDMIEKIMDEIENERIFENVCKFG